MKETVWFNRDDDGSASTSQIMPFKKVNGKWKLPCSDECCSKIPDCLVEQAVFARYGKGYHGVKKGATKQLTLKRIDINKMIIPLKYNGFDVGRVSCFNKDTGEITIELDMSKDKSKLLKEMILNDAPMSMSCKNEPCEPLSEK